jgi:hypothetical protein
MGRIREAPPFISFGTKTEKEELKKVHYRHEIYTGLREDSMELLKFEHPRNLSSRRVPDADVELATYRTQGDSELIVHSIPWTPTYSASFFQAPHLLPGSTP